MNNPHHNELHPQPSFTYENVLVPTNDSDVIGGNVYFAIVSDMH